MGPDGVTRRAVYRGANQIAGYTEPWEIAVRAGGAYVVRIPVGRYDLTGSESLTEFLTRPCRIWMELEVPRDACTNRPTGLSCWSGKAVSNTLELPERVGRR